VNIVRSLVGMLPRGISAALTVALGVALLLPAAAAAAPAQIRFDLELNSPGGCIGVYSAPDETLSIVWRGAGGELKAKISGLSEGSMGICPDDDSTFVAPGDRITAKVGSYTRNYVVPNLSLRLDRVAGVISGTGPAGRTLIVQRGSGPFGDTVQSRGVRVGQDGTWSWSRSVGARTTASVTWTSPNNDNLSIYGSAAYLTVTLGKAAFNGSASPFSEVDIAVENGNTSRGLTTAAPNGPFSGAFRKPNGRVDPIAPGDHISAPDVAADMDWIVPDVQIAADAATEMVTGQCAGTIAAIRLHRSGHQFPVGFVLVSPGSAPGYQDEFEFDFSDPRASDYVTGIESNAANVKHGDRLSVECFLESGDSVVLRSVVP